MDLDLDTLKGQQLAYFGACGNAFKVNDLVLEAVENEQDGYRSSLERVHIVGDPNRLADMIFSPTPIAVVTIEALEDASFKGHVIKDAVIHFEWGRVGTNRHDDWYPSFNATFRALDPDGVYDFRESKVRIMGDRYAHYRDLRLRKLNLLPIESKVERLARLADLRKAREAEKRVYDNSLHGSW